MKFIKEKIVGSIKDQLDFLFQNENNVDDFSLIGPEIGIDDIEGYMISGYIEIEGANARLFYYIDIDENNMVCISFLPPALPLTQNLFLRAIFGRVLVRLMLKVSSLIHGLKQGILSVHFSVTTILMIFQVFMRAYLFIRCRQQAFTPTDTHRVQELLPYMRMMWKTTQPKLCLIPMCVMLKLLTRL